MLGVVMLGDVMLGVVMLGVVMLSVVAPLKQFNSQIRRCEQDSPIGEL